MTTEEQIQRYKELLATRVSPAPWGLEIEDEYREYESHGYQYVESVNGKVGAIVRFLDDYGNDQWADAEFIALSRNLAQPMLDAWEQNLRRAELLSEYDDLVHRIGEERDAALERERALVAEVAKLQELVRLRLVDDELFLDNHPEEETIFIREWTDDAQQVLTPEPKPCKDWRHTTSLLTGVWTLEDGTKKDFGPQHIIACPTCQPVPGANTKYSKVFCGGCGFEHKSGYVDCVYMKEI